MSTKIKKMLELWCNYGVKYAKSGRNEERNKRKTGL